MSDLQPAWQEWLNSLDVPRKAAAESLCAQFRSLGVTDPVDLIRSQVMEDLPQLARFVLLRSLWHGAIDGWTKPGSLPCDLARAGFAGSLPEFSSVAPAGIHCQEVFMQARQGPPTPAAM
ncbi:hypothetical protein [Streptomyces sp. NPDC002520]